MTTILDVATDIRARVDALDWARLSASSTSVGYAVTVPVLTTTSARSWLTCSKRAVPLDDRDGPLPLRRRALPLLRPSAARHDRARCGRLLPTPGADRQSLGGPAERRRHRRSRSSTKSCSQRCHAAGQERPTPLILRYGEGDWNALHQDLYGDVFFPFQVLTILSRPGEDFDGGEFVLLEQRPRAQSRAHVLNPPQGAFVIFPTATRPNRGKNGYHRVGMRHGVCTVTRGQRTALGVIFHDAT